MPKNKTHSWEDRRVGTGHALASALIPNPKNWRRHPKVQEAAMTGALDSVGWVGAIKVNKRSGRIIDGHLRVEIAIARGDDTPIPVDYYDLSDEEEAIVLASYDPLSGMASDDVEALAELVEDIDLGLLPRELADMLEASISELEKDDDNYTRKIVAPIYEITGEKPDETELYDTSKYDALVSEIDNCDSISDAERYFLKAAAARHIKFNFAKIAEFYAHADEDLQELMENSALVIIDFGRAVENGFVQMSARLARIAGEDGGDDET